jgi:hypothetical protein
MFAHKYLFLSQSAGKIMASSLLFVTAGVSSAASPGPYSSGDDHLDGLLVQCEAAFTLYNQTLMANNPPEIVDISISGMFSSLRGISKWSEKEIRQRWALDAQALDQAADTGKGDPAGSAAARFGQCVTEKELEGRRVGTAPP